VTFWMEDTLRNPTTISIFIPPINGFWNYSRNEIILTVWMQDYAPLFGWKADKRNPGPNISKLKTLQMKLYRKKVVSKSRNVVYSFAFESNKIVTESLSPLPFPYLCFLLFGKGKDWRSEMQEQIKFENRLKNLSTRVCLLFVWILRVWR
jgi:hypothetical protein